MACALTRFGLLCRDFRISKNRSMGDQAEAMKCAVHYVSAVETGKIEPSDDYIETLGRWLQLNDSQYNALKKRRKANIIDLRQRFSTGDRSSSVRLFRKISKMDPMQIRRLRPKTQEEAKNDGRLSGPI
jgi:transcriptional regulator with XRE-family HTH domain